MNIQPSLIFHLFEHGLHWFCLAMYSCVKSNQAHFVKMFSIEPYAHKSKHIQKSLARFVGETFCLIGVYWDEAERNACASMSRWSYFVLFSISFTQNLINTLWREIVILDMIHLLSGAKLKKKNVRCEDMEALGTHQLFILKFIIWLKGRIKALGNCRIHIISL